eukprot:3992827-Prymnesium_polylepis.1
MLGDRYHILLSRARQSDEHASPSARRVRRPVGTSAQSLRRVAGLVDAYAPRSPADNKTPATHKSQAKQVPHAHTHNRMVPPSPRSLRLLSLAAPDTGARLRSMRMPNARSAHDRVGRMVGLTSVCQQSSQRRYQFTIFRYSCAASHSERGLIEE